jgi:magnesium-transporting ATPase (P-type)
LLGTVAPERETASALADVPLHTLSPVETAAYLASDLEHGLSAPEAARRLAEHGPNRLPQRTRPPYVALLARQFVSPLVLLLIAAAAVSAAIGDELEAIAIGAIVVLNAALGFVEEAAAERAVLELREAVVRVAEVVRGGRRSEIPSEELVPGDLVVLKEGDRVPADARVARSEGLDLDESALTGESLPVAKLPASVPGETPLADRTSMVYLGTGITRGRGLALVTATGVDTELGAISTLTAQAQPRPTPLQVQLGRVARAMVVLGVLLTVLLAGGMLLRGSALHTAFLLGVAVAVAAVPEGLPATVTVALALGARAMARQGAIVRRLSAIETIGEATVICTDKTGTLTENRLRLASALPSPGTTERELLAAAVLASSAELIDEETGPRVAGDPVEGALLLAAMERGLARPDLLSGLRLVEEIPFDPERREMTVVYETIDGFRTIAKGAPEVLAARAVQPAAEQQHLLDAARAWAEEGLRVLAVGERWTRDRVTGENAELSILGLVALHDPLRAEAPEAIASAQAAGVDVRMLTGDHPETARTIGHALGLAPDAVFARVTPREKLQLVERLQDEGQVVAVTGDGVNDAPALRRADVGIAMGRDGTETAREASDIVLTDDNFATIVAALREGRRIGDNVKKFVAFLLSANLGEVVLFAAAVVVGLDPPMAVVQVLVVNVLTDGLPALALARDPTTSETMRAHLGRARATLDRELVAPLAVLGLSVGGAALVAYLVGRELDSTTAQTMAFATISCGELALVYSCRSLRLAAWQVPRNAHLTASVGLSAALVFLAIYLPGLHGPLSTVGLGWRELAVVLGLATVPLLISETAKGVARRSAF